MQVKVSYILCNLIDGDMGAYMQKHDVLSIAGAAHIAAGDRPVESGWRSLPLDQRAAWFEAVVVQAVGGILGVQLGREEALMNAGLDSLGRLPGPYPQRQTLNVALYPTSRHSVVRATCTFPLHAGAVELRKELVRVTALDLPATLIFDFPSIAEMTAALLNLAPQPADSGAANDSQRRSPPGEKQIDVGNAPLNHDVGAGRCTQRWWGRGGSSSCAGAVHPDDCCTAARNHCGAGMTVGVPTFATNVKL